MVLTSLRWAFLIQHPTSASTGEILMSAEAQCVLSLYLLDGVSGESERHQFLCWGSGQMSPGEEPSGHVHTDICGFLSVFFSSSLLLFVFFFICDFCMFQPVIFADRQTDEHTLTKKKKISIAADTPTGSVGRA